MTLKNAFGDIALDSSVQQLKTILSDILTATKTGNDALSTERSSLQYAVPLNAGTGYQVGEIITLSGGTGSIPAKVKVLSVGASGEILTVSVNQIGRYSATNSTLTQGSTTGTGINATFTATFASHILAMIDTTGYSTLQFHLTSFNTGTTNVQGSLDGGLTWIVLPWTFSQNPVFSTSGTGSANTGTLNEVQHPFPLTRIVMGASTNATVSWVLKVQPSAPVTIRQGANTGSNQFWFVSNSVSNAARGAGHPSGNGGQVPIITAASTNAQFITTASAQIYYTNLVNIGTTPAYLKVYNKNSTPVPGTDTPIAVYCIPPNYGKLELVAPTSGLKYGSTSGLSIAITKLPALLDNTPLDTAGEIIGTLTFNA